MPCLTPKAALRHEQAGHRDVLAEDLLSEASLISCLSLCAFPHTRMTQWMRNREILKGWTSLFEGRFLFLMHFH